ncbi:hypothetical protein LTR10_021623 [Elasticomyces elasticus]|uniref:Arsenite methyltransferase n=1 Tax=Exophiala sideris TaxID=1016849 RepID=A0ABR0J2L4_9EURO|nr:hypothetical protein LTR10_021623 [Elasticomyces elasticus]KAK5024133.1 hypothetical protein LTS07_008868 [Exophiala sideris]KAK5029007.1 hypothetical protein LTR13_008877 [Exophiala sideris]KAK5054845.1 hypothetical protein LTR69_008753 [Exophiala sideris]KAK5178830.1 hypothetical protein LTR44_008658 [Eurotiomycetes sp. CCFEE 6388]
MNNSTVYKTVNNGYSSIATEAYSNPSQPSKSAQIATSFGYSAEQLASLPAGTNLGLSCGNPLATANLHPSETMLDLGSGGGLDCLIAAKQMLQAEPLPTGKIYGTDRSSKMIDLARRNATESNLPEGLVEFIEAPITKIPLEDASADLVVSNCVINLVPDEDKPKVFNEIYRLLRPGGRVAISDLLAKKGMPDHVRNDAALLIGCVAGASLLEEYRGWMIEAGFQDSDIVFVNTNADLNVYHDQTEPLSCCTPKQSCGNGPKNVDRLDFNEWVAAYQIYAVKGKGAV